MLSNIHVNHNEDAQNFIHNSLSARSSHYGMSSYNSPSASVYSSPPFTFHDVIDSSSASFFPIYVPSNSLSITTRPNNGIFKPKSFLVTTTMPCKPKNDDER